MSEELIRCPRCNGLKHVSGWNQEHVSVFIGDHGVRDIHSDVAFRITCPRCNGTGMINNPAWTPDPTPTPSGA